MDNTFVIYREDDYPEIYVEGNAKIGRFVPRKINHPHFKNGGLKMASVYLKDR